ncbi:VOC family protein [Jiella mangrovi]|uniref:VOC family protein n=1 Tax=Jiella mangrovi TaxID=2821407 RepID=A0ABS4BJW0_9HYPH|nr:VOC family protein [Jiella mangrovi]MBP0617020.1 VOC family protein [Jiella mangrovi]
MAFDHFVHLVHDLDAASRDFSALGFTVQERADTIEGKTRFRFVCFDDGSYILLTAFADQAAQTAHRLGEVLAHGEGPADYSFTVDSSAAAGETLTAAGFPVKGPVPVSNVVASGERWALDLLMTGRGAGGDVALPFLVSDVEGRSARVPAPRPHANGATGIRSLTVASKDPRRCADALTAMGGREVAHGDQGIDFDFGDVTMRVIDCAAASDVFPGGGMVSCEIGTKAELPEGGRLLDPALAHGAAMRLVAA